MFYLERLAQERRKDLLREAEHYRLITLAQSNTPKRKRSIERWLASLGTRLCVWGGQLQKRFGETEAENTASTLGSRLVS
jgi:hypothetical protein